MRHRRDGTWGRYWVVYTMWRWGLHKCRVLFVNYSALLVFRKWYYRWRNLTLWRS